MSVLRHPHSRSMAVCAALAILVWAPALADDEQSASGTLIANGETIELPFVYAWALDEGFYEPTDPAWKLLFVEHAIEERELDESIWDAAYVELGITESAEFGDGPELQVYSQSLKLSADSGGNISGGTYPEIELTSTGPERFTGRIFHAEQQEFFDDTFQYDFTFDVPFSNPNAPLGEPLGKGGGDPGKAYMAWVEALHSGDVERLKALVPAEMGAQLEDEDAAEMIEFMALMTPTDLEVLGGSSDGQTAILEVEGKMDGERLQGEVTLEKMGDFWMATKSSW